MPGDIGGIFGKWPGTSTNTATGYLLPNRGLIYQPITSDPKGHMPPLMMRICRFEVSLTHFGIHLCDFLSKGMVTRVARCLSPFNMSFMAVSMMLPTFSAASTRCASARNYARTVEAETI